jgi:hypothetical protein
MKSVIELDIDVPQARLAALFADPRHNTAWMDDLERLEPISGEPGLPGSKYRLVPKKGKMVFVATVITRTLPTEVRLRLDASHVTVSVRGTFAALSSGRTRLTSEEVFSFKGLIHKVLGFLAQTSIRNAHRRHLEAFKRFAQEHG